MSKALRDEKDIVTSDKENKKFFLLENVIQNLSGNAVMQILKIKLNLIIQKSYKQKHNKINVLKKIKLERKKLKHQKLINTNKPIENVINKEIKPIIQKWISKNLRTFVKKVIMEEFKVIKSCI